MIRTEQTSRRRFLMATAATMAGGYMTTTSASSQVAQPGPNDTLNMALIGCGARGANQVLPSFMELPGVRITAVCDVNSEHLQRGREKAGGSAVTTYHDFRERLAEANKFVNKEYRDPWKSTV